ncbi:hypothetical protein [Zhenhengia sp.]|uniref:hypothetical protein n=1 Tax=Zhenhengia sp. TaxID=2944208 RepID=UPI003078F1CA
MSKCANCYYFAEQVYINGDKFVEYCHWQNKELKQYQIDQGCDDFIHEEVVADSMLEEWQK